MTVQEQKKLVERIAYLEKNVSLLSEIVSFYRLDARQNRIVDGILAPLTNEETDIGESFRYEFVVIENSLRAELELDRDAQEEDDVFNKWFMRLYKTILYKRNATANDNYDRFSRLVKVSGYSAVNLLRHIQHDAPKVAEAETEIMAGAVIEYSGMILLVHKLTRMMLLFVVPMFIVVVFLGGISFASITSTVLGLLKYVALLVVIVLIRNTCPRLRIDQAIKLFWGPMTIIAIVAVILAFLGIWLGAVFFNNFLVGSDFLFGVIPIAGSGFANINTGGVIPLMNFSVGIKVIAGLFVIVLVMAYASSIKREAKE